MSKQATSTLLNLTVVVECPVGGVAYGLQRGRDQLDFVQVAQGGLMRFDFQVEQRPTPVGTVDVRGAHVQGPRGNRFIYINTGTYAGQTDSRWSRRAKIALNGIPASPDGAKFQARFTGTAADGGPACASVLLLDGGWIEIRSA
ncbi:DUF5990 family protein [Chitinimonas koreensis]|uniref:DUF5990 family protein n=1 Tax=Chitinimonas koreensis TaxID=356302 RepID=UPI0004184925|nr:DUF5990 family protein [Chitinimonas koreensis]QNM96757.1 hypothetical protein H9L41_23940 [Chitinimonas koreensis]